jgi:dipeptidyl-peptidase-4
MTRNLFAAALCWLLLLPAYAQQRQTITVEDFFQNNVFAQRTVSGVNWMRDGRYYTSLTEADGNPAVVKYDVTTGRAVETLLSVNDLLKNNAGSLRAFDDYLLSPDETQMLIGSEVENIYRRSTKGNYFVYNLQTKKLTRLSAGGKQSYPTFSPDGRQVAFARDNNLFLVDLAGGTEKALTTTGKANELIHGSADWVYEEEFSFAQAFAWSPDGKKIAYWSFDEKRVPEYNLQIWGPLYPKDHRFKYPKAGEANSVVGISVYHLNGDKTVKVDLGRETDMYVPRINWTANPDVLSVRRMNRLQNRLDILHADAATGKTTAVLTEQSDKYVDLELTDDLTYLADGKGFIHSSERSGYKHLYLFDMAGKLVRQLTTGNWEVETFLGLDEKRGLLYFTSTEVSPLERHLYSVSITGKNKKKLTAEKGTHRLDMSPDFSFYLDYHSSAAAPTVVSLWQAPEGKQVKVLEDNAALKAKLTNYQISPKEFFQFNTTDNVALNGWIIRPTNFVQGQKYPVLMFVYGGPGSQQVLDSWDNSNFYWFQMLAQKGYVVACVDNRGTGGRGTAFRQSTYGALGKYEVQDQIEAARYLGKLPYVDAARIGMHGWSYGGYMTALCATLGADVFKATIAGAPVTSWRFYDTIYTERYLKTPKLNPEGYDDYSPLNHATKLKGKFLLIHGTGDDNVHFQNSVALAQALINAGKPFESFYYPNQAHGVRGLSRVHLYKLMTDFITRNL